MATKWEASMRQMIRKVADKYRDHQASDRDLLQRFAEKRDEAAFAVLVRRHNQLVLGVGQRVLGHYQDAEDICQASFLLLAQKAHAVPWRDSVANWLYSATYHLAIRARDSAKRRQTREGKVLPKAIPDGLDEVTSRDFQTVLDQELVRLPKKYSAPIVLCCLEGKSRDEASRYLGLPLASVKSRLEEGRELLRRRLIRRGITFSTAFAGAMLAADPAQATLSASAIHATSQAALQVLAGQTIVGVVSAKVIALIKGGAQAMLLMKVKVAMAALASAALVTTAILAVPVLAPGNAESLQSSSKALSLSAASSQEMKKPDALPINQQNIVGTKDGSGKVSYRGLVLDPHGKPVAGAKLYLTPPHGPGEEPFSSPVYATTGPDGRFDFAVPRKEGIDQGAVVAAVAPNYGVAWIYVSPEAKKNDAGLQVTAQPSVALSADGKPAERDDLKLQLVEDDVPITGQIVDLEGQPVAGAIIQVLQVYATPEEDLGPWLGAAKGKKGTTFELYNKYFSSSTIALSTAATSDAEGRVRISGIGRNRLVLARLDGPRIVSQHLHILTRPEQTIVVLRDQGFPEEGEPPIFTTYYGSDFRHAAPPSRPIIGVVRDKDTQKPLGGVKVQSYSIAPYRHVNNNMLHAITDEQGRYQLLGMPKGEGNSIAIEPGRDQPYISKHEEVRDTAGIGQLTLDVELQRGIWIEGKITDKASGKPIQAGVEYYAIYSNPNLRDYPGFDGTILHHSIKSSKEDGSYKVVGLPGPGLVAVWNIGAYLRAPDRDDEFGTKEPTVQTAPYHIVIPGNFCALGRIDPEKGSVTVQRDIHLEQGWSFKGTTVGLDEKPLVGARRLLHSGANCYFGEPMKTAEFTCGLLNPRIPRTEYFLYAAKNLVGAVQPPKEDGGSVVVQMEPGSTITGRLVGIDGMPRVGVELELNFRKSSKAILGWREYPCEKVLTDSEGRFRIEPLLPGFEYRLSAGKESLLFSGLDLRFGQTKDLGDVRVERKGVSP